MKKLHSLLLLLFSLLTVFALVSCELPFDLPFLGGDDTDGTGDGGTDTDGDEEDENLDGLVLISNGKAKFRVVYSTSAGSNAVKTAEDLVKTLRKLGVEIEDAINDRNAADVTDCEILIGTGVKHRGDDCSVSDKALGKDGYILKAVGKRVVMAGGSADALSKAYKIFTADYLGIGARTETLTSVAVPEDLNVFKETNYLLKSITVAGNDLKNYKLVYDISNMSEDFSIEKIESFKDDLYAESGIWLDDGSIEELASYANYVLIRYADVIDGDDDNHGFVVKVDEGGNLIVECSYANAFNAAFEKFTNQEILGKMGDLKISDTYSYHDTVSEVRYSDFGAKGDGRTDDFIAIYNTHVYANQCGQTVLGDEGATYYINEDFTKEVPVRTNTNFMGAKFVVNDVGDIAYRNRSLALFNIAKDYPTKVYKGDELTSLIGDGVTITNGETEFPWIVPLLEAKSLVRVINANHKDFIRHGSNENSGNTRRDSYIIDVDGSLDKDSVIAFEFDEITEITVYRIDDAPIIFENGEFENICCQTVAETKFAVKYHAYYRGLKIYRSNTLVRNIKHTMINEPELNVNSDKDVLTPNYGERNESYPYYGFLHIQASYNVHAEDVTLDGHTTYYEDKPYTASTGKIPDPVPAGSYDLIVEASSHTYLTRVRQQDNLGTGLGDSRYWGIMSSNFTKNMFFTECEINRFDAHCGFWNATLIDTTIGHSFNVIGGGKLYCENVTKIAGNSFIYHRGDYGATFNGDIELVNCEHLGVRSYYSNRRNAGFADYSNPYETMTIINAGFGTNNPGEITYVKDEDGNVIMENGKPKVDKDGRYWYWDFGYTCYMPRNLVIDNFVANGATTLAIYNNLIDDIFKDIPNQYQITETITLKNMQSNVVICTGSDGYSKLKSIPIYYE